MAVISLYTTAFSLAQANMVLDTHINILPFSPDLIRMNCASQQLNDPAHPPTAPILPSLQLDSGYHNKAFEARAERIAAHVAAGKVVVVKNGAKVWTHLSPDVNPDDMHVVIMNSVWEHAETSNDANERAVSQGMLQSWPLQFVLDATNKAVMEVQNALRDLIRSHIHWRLTGLSGDVMFKPYVHRQKLRVVVALGGLSECGKSSMGGLIDTGFGQQGRREKFAYLLDNVSKQLGCNIYAFPDTVQAHILIQQVEDYSKAHFWVSVLSLESLHRFGSIVETKRILGSLLQIVYIDVSEAERITRQVFRVGEALAEAKIQELKDKDVVKKQRGAERVMDIADFILDNNGSFMEASQTLTQFIRAKMDI
ncbi:hypothetical protein C8R43DRAFT_345596 [Mycena crocata]|nr:hypothetical protein C8R43DRAFT_345596 [Mycena crocata]